VAQTVLLGSSITAAIGVAGYRFNVPEGLLFFGWLAGGVIYHVIFGSGLVMGRRTAPDTDGLVASAASLGQRRR
jgi:hypothetical protein